MTMTPPDGKKAVGKNYSILRGLNSFRNFDLKQILFGHAPLALADQDMVSGVNFVKCTQGSSFLTDIHTGKMLKEIGWHFD